MKKLTLIVLSIISYNALGQIFAPSPASTVLFDEKFHSKFDMFGDDNTVFWTNWKTVENDYLWTSALHSQNPNIPEGMAARLDNMLNGYGSFSNPKKLDFITTGGLALWGNNFKTGAKLQSLKMDGKGAAGVAYYKDADNYRVCFVAVDEAPGCTGPVDISDVNSGTDPNASNAVLSIVEVKNGVPIGCITNPTNVSVSPLPLVKFNSGATLNADKSYQLIFTQHDDGTSDCEMKTNTTVFQVTYAPGVPVTGTARFAIANFGNKVLATEVSVEAGVVDTDQDGVSNAEESLIGTDPTKADSDADNISDREEAGYIYKTPDGALAAFYAPHDTDKDLSLGTPDSPAKIDALDLDSDNDGISDKDEAGDADLATQAKDTNHDGIPDYRDYVFPVNPNDDPDMDGLTNHEEAMAGTDPNNPDTDGDGLKDGAEVKTHHTNPLKKDSDNDLLTDGEEVNTHNTDPLDPDTDNGGVKDGQEVLVDHTNPLDPSDDKVATNPGGGGNGGGNNGGNPPGNNTDGNGLGNIGGNQLGPEGVMGAGGCNTTNDNSTQSLLLFLGVGIALLIDRRKKRYS